jgi:hypothetical protein
VSIQQGGKLAGFRTLFDISPDCLRSRSLCSGAQDRVAGADQGVGGGAGRAETLTAMIMGSFDRPADQGARGRADNRAGGPLAMRVDRPSNQCATGSTDN